MDNRDSFPQKKLDIDKAVKPTGLTREQILYALKILEDFIKSVPPDLKI